MNTATHRFYIWNKPYNVYRMTSSYVYAKDGPHLRYRIPISQFSTHQLRRLNRLFPRNPVPRYKRKMKG